ncbi:MAG: DUF2207 domain-containing protein [Coriobacteriia bacterium]|nr:DUF2207 domain-containing protein [Coriobacteriia bacterium]
MRRTALRLAVATLAMLALACALATPAFAKDYTMGPVDIEAVVGPDGSVLVTERRTFDFDGDFTFVSWKLNKTGAKAIEILGVDGPDGPLKPTNSPTAADDRPPNTYLVSDLAGAVEARAFFRYGDESVPLTLRYRVLGAATRWEDTGELYWQFIGDESEKGVSDVRMTVVLPNPGQVVEPGSDVRAWIHGPLTGSFDVLEDGTIEAELDELDPYTFVEVRALFPEQWLSNAQTTQGQVVEDVLAEEGRLADEANRLRRRAQSQRNLGLFGSPALSLGVLALAVVLFLRHGKEHRTQFQGEYYRELPAEMPPALVGALWRMGNVEDSDVAATLMNLANNGIVSMQPVSVTQQGGFLNLGTKDVQTYELRLDRSKLSEADPIERELAETLFDRVGSRTDVFTIDELKTYAKMSAESFAKSMKNWKSSVKAEAKRRGFFEGSGSATQAGLFVAATIVFAAGIYGTILSGNAIPVVLGIPVAVVVGVLAFFSSRRSREANELHAKYEGVRNYIRDFSRLDEAPPQHVKLWEHFLVLAVVFGIAKEVIEQMRVRIPDVVNDPHFQTTYWWVYSSGSYQDSPVGALQSGFTSAASIASSQMSSSSGGGGGFSGGGGGGGGGGGVSAG